MKKIFSKEFTIGICVVIALAILFCGIEFLKGISIFSPANFYKAYYTNVAGLEVSAPVHIDGFKVGQVRDIVFDYKNPGKPIEVLLALDDDLELPADTHAVIESSMLSGASIKLVLGKSTTKLVKGAQIPTSQEPDLMATVTGEMLPTVNSILPKVDSLMYNLNMITAHPAIYSSLTRLDAITGNLESGAIGLNQTINGINGQLPGILGNAYHATTRLDSTMVNLQLLSYNLKKMPLNATMDNVNEVSANLAAFSRDLKENNGTLGLLMKDPELYNRLTQVSADIDSLLIDIQRNPKRYISIKLL